MLEPWSVPEQRITAFCTLQRLLRKLFTFESNENELSKLQGLNLLLARLPGPAHAKDRN